MAPYLLNADPDKFDALVLVKDQDWDLFNQFDGRRLAETWTPVAVEILKQKRRGDLLYLTSRVPVFRPRTWRVLEPLIGPFVEALPVKTTDETFFAINVLAVLDCLDLERSEVLRFPSGGIMYIQRHAFKEGSLDNVPIFKVRGAELKEVLVSSEFKRVVEQNRLRGLVFKPAS
jgi:hypothetical protein